MTPPRLRTRRIRQAASVLLAYPDERLLELYAPIAACVAELRPFVAYARRIPLLALQSEYVETFDRRRRCCLYLTYYTAGDTRRRGGELAALRGRYADCGFELEGGELPDFLPAVLEFAALPDARAAQVGEEILLAHRPGLELLRIALRAGVTSPEGGSASAYASVVDAVCGTLPAAPTDVERAVRRLAAEGPPAESVGVYS